VYADLSERDTCTLESFIRFEQNIMILCSGDREPCILLPAHQKESYAEYQNTKCRINTVIPPDDGPGKVRNM
jgi:hypothetical protein